MANNPWTLFAEERPNILYGAMKPSTGSKSFLDYWAQSHGNVWDEYMGQLGKMALSGQEPSLLYGDFLGSYPWLQKWWEQSPAQRGERPSLFAPNVRWQV